METYPFHHSAPLLLCGGPWVGCLIRFLYLPVKGCHIVYDLGIQAPTTLQFAHQAAEVRGLRLARISCFLPQLSGVFCEAVDAFGD